VPQPGVQGRRLAYVPIQAEYFDALVIVGTQDGARTVGGTIVNDQKVEITIRL